MPHYQALLNFTSYQHSVTKTLKEFSAAGNIVVQINGHRWLQVLAISTAASRLIVMDRVAVQENKATRDTILSATAFYLQRINISLARVTFVMDGWSRVPLNTIGIVHPILSTGSHHLKLRLLQTFATMTVVWRDSGELIHCPTGYETIRQMLGIMSHSEYAAWITETKNVLEKTKCLTTVDWAQLSGDLEEIICDEQLQVKFGDDRWQALKTIYTNALNCALLLAALEADDRLKLIFFGEKLMTLTGTAMLVQNLEVRSSDIFETVSGLVQAARGDASFSVHHYNLILSYKLRKLELNNELLTVGKMLPAKICSREFETVTFKTPIFIAPLLAPVEQFLIDRVAKHTAKNE